MNPFWWPFTVFLGHGWCTKLHDCVDICICIFICVMISHHELWNLGKFGNVMCLPAQIVSAAAGSMKVSADAEKNMILGLHKMINLEIFVMRLYKNDRFMY